MFPYRFFRKIIHPYYERVYNKKGVINMTLGVILIVMGLLLIYRDSKRK